ncbi:hypothetical protein D9M71_469310 [compost metagenome]
MEDWARNSSWWLWALTADSSFRLRRSQPKQVSSAPSPPVTMLRRSSRFRRSSGRAQSISTEAPSSAMKRLAICPDSGRKAKRGRLWPAASRDSWESRARPIRAMPKSWLSQRPPWRVTARIMARPNRQVMIASSLRTRQ